MGCVLPVSVTSFVSSTASVMRGATAVDCASAICAKKRHAAQTARALPFQDEFIRLTPDFSKIGFNVCDSPRTLRCQNLLRLLRWNAVRTAHPLHRNFAPPPASG